MSEARELYLKTYQNGLIKPGDEATQQALVRAADLWRSSGRYFGAGYALTHAVHAAWGNPSQMWAHQQAALDDFQRAGRHDADRLGASRRTRSNGRHLDLPRDIPIPG